jgi:nucleoside-diphosphate-sugar epimerase
MTKQKIFVTGAGGYIGSKLCQELIASGYEVTAFDRFYFGIDQLDQIKEQHLLTKVRKDIRDISVEDLKGHYAVIDLAAISNDPSGDLDPDLTRMVNQLARIDVAKKAKEAKVKKYVLSSSCSVYGGNDEVCVETTVANPLSVYAQAAFQAELGILELGDSAFTTYAFRNGTVHGLSSRMRFDLVVNAMTLSAFQKGKISILGDGEQWRPLVHVTDLAQSFVTSLSLSDESLQGQVFNIATENLKVATIAYKVKESLGRSATIEFVNQDLDKRDYRVSTDKAISVGLISSSYSVERSSHEIYEALTNGLTAPTEKTSTVGWYKKILESEKIVNEIALNGRLL